MLSDPREKMQTRVSCQVSSNTTGVLERAYENITRLNSVFTMFDFTNVSGTACNVYLVGCIW